jgi:hypothetical protein
MVVSSRLVVCQARLGGLAKGVPLLKQAAECLAGLAGSCVVSLAPQACHSLLRHLDECFNPCQCHVRSSSFLVGSLADTDIVPCLARHFDMSAQVFLGSACRQPLQALPLPVSPPK